jgi:uncharacterized protein (TIGR00730 family)
MKRTILMVVSLTLFSVVLACNSETTIQLNPVVCKKSNRRVPDGDIPTPKDVAIDVYCAEQFIKNEAPHGVVTIFGSARAKEHMTSYKQTREFAFKWSKTKLGKKYPILTGGGPGIMEAGNRGAKEAGGKSLYYSTYFGSGAEKTNQYVTGGFMFSSFAQREADMVDRGAALVAAPGGVGTEWEIFESLSKIQTKKKRRVPFLLLGKRSVWQPLFTRLNYLAEIGTINKKDIKLLQVAETPDQAIAILKKALK